MNANASAFVFFSSDEDGSSQTPQMTSDHAKLRRSVKVAGTLVASVVTGSLAFFGLGVSSTPTQRFAALAPPADGSSAVVPEGRLLLATAGCRSRLFTEDGELDLGDTYTHEVSPDGSLILAARGRTPRGCSFGLELLVLDPLTKATTSIARAGPNESLSSAAWSPDGSQIGYLVSTHRGNPSKPGNGQPLSHTVCLVEVRTGVNQCFPGVDAYFFDWAPDGARLVVDTAEDVRLLDIASGEFSLLVPPDGGQSGGTALETAGLGRPDQFTLTKWSSSGRYLATLVFLTGGSESAFVVPMVLTSSGDFVAMGRPSGEFAEWFEWSPAEDVLAYTQGKAPYQITEVNLLDPQSGAESLLASSAGRNYPIVRGLEWSPSGRWLAIAQWSPDRSEVLIIDKDGAEQASLSTGIEPSLRNWAP